MLTLPSGRQDVNRQAPVSRQQARAQTQQQEKEFEARFSAGNESFRRELEATAKKAAEHKFESDCEEQVEQIVGRKNGARRDRKDKTEVEECCNRCGTHLRSHFLRKGHRPRCLQTLLGVLLLWVPRVECECGGDVSISFRRFAPFARRFEDVAETILLLTGMCLSLRQVRTFFDARHLRISIATIGGQVADVADLSAQVFSTALGMAPPVVMLDGIFAYMAEETGEFFTDKRGRKRPRRRVRKKPLLVAWGIWPDSGEKVLLGWVVGQEEDRESWLKLLKDLDKRGVCYRNGLRLFIHDGSTGLEAAFEELTFGPVEHQRCIFHKMRNVVEAVKGEEKATREQKQARRKEVLADLVSIWDGCNEAEARARFEAFAAKWREKEPLAVERLRKGFDATVVYYRVQDQARAEGQEWPAHFLRTTSFEERWNRTIRMRMRASTIFQTEKGARGAVYLAIGCRGKTMPGQIARWLREIRQGLATLPREGRRKPPHRS